MSHGVDGMRKRNRILFIFSPFHFFQTVSRIFTSAQFESVSYRLLVDSTVKVNDFFRRFSMIFGCTPVSTACVWLLRSLSESRVPRVSDFYRTQLNMRNYIRKILLFPFLRFSAGLPFGSHYTNTRT